MGGGGGGGKQLTSSGRTPRLPRHHRAGETGIAVLRECKGHVDAPRKSGFVKSRIGEVGHGWAMCVLQVQVQTAPSQAVSRPEDEEMADSNHESYWDKRLGVVCSQIIRRIEAGSCLGSRWEGGGIGNLGLP
jgi:hypothetical protein